ncbi:MAG: thiamine pyrophosphate-dependent enzyme [Candidatus Thorarchaeota archaeon]
MEDLKTYAEITWCPGCGNFGIFTAVRNAILLLEENGIGRDNIVITSGIGCHAKIFDYLNLSGFYGLHGRNCSNSEGIKIANPDLKVINFSGDANGLAEGLAHTMFAAKRNQDITFILHNNSVYALTTGQFSPLSEKGWKGPSTPRGSYEKPFNPISLMIEVGATFVARGFAGDTKHLTDLIVQGVKHEGFAFIEVLQPAVPYHKWEEYREHIEYLEKESENQLEAIKIAKEKHKFTIGIFYRTHRTIYHKELYGEHNPVTKKIQRMVRLEKIQKILGSL